MPLPKPKDDESKEDFVGRCMGNETMKEEYPDNDQRLAVCYSLFKDEKESNMAYQPIERRMYSCAELRVEGGKTEKLAGYAAVFDVLTDEFWGMREKVARGAFEESIKVDDVRMLFNHDPNYVLARNRSKTLKMWEDKHGLAFEATPPDTQWAQDLVKSIKRGDVTQNSFGFVILDEGEPYKEDGVNIRTLKKVKLYDISAVTYPAYESTEIYVRNRGNIYVRGLDKIFSVSKPDAEVILMKSSDGKELIPKEIIPDNPLIDPSIEAMLSSKSEEYKRRYK